MENKKGLTLIELIISVGLSSILLVMIISFFISNVKNNTMINNLNELQYQAKIVNNYLYENIAQSNYFSYSEATKTMQLRTYTNNIKDYELLTIKLKSNGDLIENYNELANYIASIDIDYDEEKHFVHYIVNFEKGNNDFRIENSVYMRNAVN